MTFLETIDVLEMVTSQVHVDCVKQEDTGEYLCSAHPIVDPMFNFIDVGGVIFWIAAIVRHAPGSQIIKFDELVKDITKENVELEVYADYDDENKVKTIATIYLGDFQVIPESVELYGNGTKLRFVAKRKL